MRRLSRRTIGKTMIAVGVAGVVLSITAVIVGQSLILQVETSVDDSLQLTGEALAAVKDSIAVTDSIVDTVRSGMTSIETTIGSVGTSLEETSVVVAESGQFLGGSLPDALQAVNGVLPTIESIASSVDSALRALERVPFGPNYNPVQPFDEAIAQLSVAIEPLPTQLRTLSADFDSLGSATRTISIDVAALADDIAILDGQLANVSTLLNRYATTATRAESLTTASRRDLSTSVASTRLLLILLGTVFALGQIVPIWLGATLVAQGSGQTVITRRSNDAEEPVRTV